ncbi:MAG TPA: hypothetical protein VKU85_05365 [bacterium]|nr:hypothetical protein [bacterium]
MKALSTIMAALVLAASALPTPARAEVPGILAGLDEVYVRVDYLSDVVLGAGMKDHDLLIQLADHVRGAGILVLQAGPEDSSGPLLALTVESVELPTGDVALHAALELREVVELDRRPGVYTLGSTWYSSMLTASPRMDVAGESRALVAALSDQFVADLAASVAP